MDIFNTHRIDEIVSQLKKACEAYYQSDSPVMSDADFDKLKDELTELDPTNNFLKTVGAPVDGGELQKVRHEIPMGSLKKINNSEGEFNTWLNSVKNTAGSNPTLCVNWKLDGSSLELIYRKGEFVQAITRGDGEIGEDVTHTIKNAQGFPKKIPESVNISVRAEALFRLSDWSKFLNKEGKNPRNACAGTVRRTDGRNSEHIHCVAFNIIGLKKWATFKEKLGWLDSHGFEVTQTYFITPDKMKKLVDQTIEKRSDLAYEIDGLVVSLDNCDHQDSLGEKDGLPYWARAWKFPAMGAFSKLLDVTWNVGTRGTINPVAIIEPAEVGGVTIRNVSLHNMDEIERLGIKIGDEVEVIRAGDVIPGIVRIISHAPYNKSIICNECPACGAGVIRKGPFLYCTNDNCEGILNKRIMKYIKKREIMFLGDSALDKLIEVGAVTSIKDLYFLTVEKMVKAGLGSSMSQKILDEIKKSMDVALSDLIGSLSIDLLGRSEAQNIVDGGFATLSQWKAMQPSDLMKLGGYQETKAGRICNGLRSNWHVIEELYSILKVQEGKIQPKARPKGSLSGLSYVICLTGTMSRARKLIAADIEAAGHIVADEVSSEITHLCQADPSSQSSKSKKASKLGIPVISEEELMKLLR